MTLRGGFNCNCHYIQILINMPTAQKSTWNAFSCDQGCLRVAHIHESQWTCIPPPPLKAHFDSPIWVAVVQAMFYRAGCMFVVSRLGAGCCVVWWGWWEDCLSLLCVQVTTYILVMTELLQQTKTWQYYTNTLRSKHNTKCSFHSCNSQKYIVQTSQVRMSDNPNGVPKK